jgi:hypothetical protein
MPETHTEPPAPAGENWIIRRLRRSVRLQYLLRRVVIDGTLSANPLAWLPVLLSGPRPPSGPGLRKAISNWSRRRFRGTGCEMRVEEVDAPPPFLEDGVRGTREGVALSVRCPDVEPTACLQAWVAADGSRGTYAIFEEGGSEIATHALEPFTDEGEAIGQLDRVAREFVGEHVLGRAFEAWLDEYSHAWLLVEHPVSPEVAQRQNSDTWTYALTPHGDKSIIIGRSPLNCIGSIEVGVFYADGQDALVRQHHVGYAESPAALRDLLTKSFGKSPDDTVLAAWMLHRVVPPLQPAR